MSHECNCRNCSANRDLIEKVDEIYLHSPASLSPKDLDAHVRWLAQEHSIRIRKALTPIESHARIAQREVFLLKVSNDGNYAVALHEMGHINGHNAGTPVKQLALQHVQVYGELAPVEAHEIVLREEEAAWDWAKDHALLWTPAMQKAMDLGLSTYRDNYERAKELQGVAA